MSKEEQPLAYGTDDITQGTGPLSAWARRTPTCRWIWFWVKMALNLISGILSVLGIYLGTQPGYNIFIIMAFTAVGLEMAFIGRAVHSRLLKGPEAITVRVWYGFAVWLTYCTFAFALVTFITDMVNVYD